MDLISDTYISLDQIASGIVNRIFNRFPAIQAEIMDIVTKVLQKEREKARTIVEALIDSEMNYLFTNNRDFKDNSAIMMPGQQVQSSGNVFVDQLRSRVDNYFSIVLRNVKDSIPKAIGYFLVRKSQEKLQMALFDSMNNNK